METAAPLAARPASRQRARQERPKGKRFFHTQGDRLRNSGQTSILPAAPEVRSAIGKRTFVGADQYKDWEYLRHAHGYGATFQPEPSQRTTKFLKGFYRRPATTIAGEYVRPAYYKVKQERAERNAEFRTKRLHERTARNRFNPVTGEDGAPETAARTTGKKHLSASPSATRRREGEVAMRSSANRFFSEDLLPGRRADSIRGEGFVSTRRTSSLIGYGRADLPSEGAREVLAAPQYGARRDPLPEAARRRAAAAVKPPWVE